MSALEWLALREDGLGHVPAEDQREMMEFMMVWSYFEARFLGTNGTPETIVDLAVSLEQRGLIQIDHLGDSLDYLRNRYVVAGELTGRFERLNLRRKDNVETVKSVLLGTEHSPKALLVCCLTIVLRYRNNLFHGLKWAYDLRDQRENFIVANRILMNTAEMTGRSR
jgi:hypothetical protein